MKNHIKKISKFIAMLMLGAILLVASTGSVFAARSYTNASATNSITPAITSLSAAPLFLQNGLSKEASELFFELFEGNGIDIENDTLRQGELFSILGHIRLFDTVGTPPHAAHINVAGMVAHFTNRLWRPVKLDDGILTLWMTGSYRTYRRFGPNRNYYDSDVRATLLQDFNFVLNSFSYVSSAIALPQDVSWQMNQATTSGTIYGAAPPTDLIWIPSFQEMVGRQTWGFSSSGDTAYGARAAFDTAPGALTHAFSRSGSTADSSRIWRTVTDGRVIGHAGASSFTHISENNGIRPALHIDLRYMAEMDTVTSISTPPANSELLERIIVLESQVSDLADTIDTLTQQLAALDTSNTANATLIATLTTTVQTMNDMIISLQNQISDLEDKIANGDFDGSDGQDGNRGSMIFTGTIFPTDALRIGDLFINVLSWNMYRLESLAPAVWVNIGNIQGASGNDGNSSDTIIGLQNELDEVLNKIDELENGIQLLENYIQSLLNSNTNPFDPTLIGRVSELEGELDILTQAREILDSRIVDLEERIYILSNGNGGNYNQGGLGAVAWTLIGVSIALGVISVIMVIILISKRKKNIA